MIVYIRITLDGSEPKRNLKNADEFADTLLGIKKMFVHIGQHHTCILN